MTKMTTINPMFPKLEYSTYVPQQVDIENNVQTKIESNFNSNFDNYTVEIKKLHDRMNTQEQKMDKLQDEFYSTIKIRCCDGIIGIVLIIVIYVKVYS